MSQETLALIKGAVLTKALAGVEEAQQRCQEAAEHLHAGQYLGAIGALAGLEERVRYVSTILSVLRDIEPALNQPSIPFNREKGETQIE